MTNPVDVLVKMILSLTGPQLVELRHKLDEAWGDGGDPAGVTAVIPPTVPLREGGAEAPLYPDTEGLPEDYWETAT